MLHGAPVSLVVVGTLVHYEDRVFFPIASELFAFHRKYEKLFTNVQSVSRVALIQGSGSEFDGIIKILSEQHIIYDVILPSQIGNSRTPRVMDDYELIILDDIRNMSEEMVAMLDNYVEKGGKLLATGAPSTRDENGKALNRIQLKSLGVNPDYELYTKSQATYLKVSENDKERLGREEMEDFSLMMMNSDFLKCKPRQNAQCYLRLLPSNMYGPAEKTYYRENELTEFPGIIEYSSGKGKSVYIPWQIGSEYNIKGNYAQRNLFLAALSNLLGLHQNPETDASPLIEMTHLANLNGEFEWIGLINHSGFLGNSVREPVIIHNTTIRFKPIKPVSQLRLLRSGRIVKYKQLPDGWIECSIPEIGDFEMLLCLYEQR
jgi:hypothetical protein